jgi:hypothetical protein
MNPLKLRIARLVKILGQPYGEIVGTFWINDDVFVDTIAVIKGGRDFEMSIFSQSNEEDFEAIIPSDYLTDEELEKLVTLLEEYLIKS